MKEKENKQQTANASQGGSGDNNVETIEGTIIKTMKGRRTLNQFLYFGTAR